MPTLLFFFFRSPMCAVAFILCCVHPSWWWWWPYAELFAQVVAAFFCQELSSTTFLCAKPASASSCHGALDFENEFDCLFSVYGFGMCLGLVLVTGLVSCPVFAFVQMYLFYLPCCREKQSRKLFVWFWFLFGVKSSPFSHLVSSVKVSYLTLFFWFCNHGSSSVHLEW